MLAYGGRGADRRRTPVVAAECPIMGLGSFGNAAFLGSEARSMDGTARSKFSPAE
jgi:hypothetical protein